MPAGRTQTPLWLLPRPKSDLPSIHTGRPRIALGLGLLALGALVPAFLFLAPDSRWAPQDLVVLLLAAGFISYSAAAPLRGSTSLDAGFIAALLGVVFLGPLPGAIFFAAPEVGAWLSGKPTVRSVANLASVGWAALAATFVLEALSFRPPIAPDDPAEYVAIAAAGLVLISVNYLLGVVLVDVLREGISLRVLVRQEFLSTIPAIASLLAVGVATAFLYEQFGIPGLAPLAAVVVLPKMLASRFLRPRPLQQLNLAEATALYARAMADVLRMDRDRKRVLADAATHLGGSASLTRIGDFEQVMQAVLYCNEHWDGEGGFPGAVAGESIPLESRVLAVASAWSVLTAKGTRELTPEQALVELKARAGSEFDPHVVAAAVRVVDDDTLPAPKPRKGHTVESLG